MRPEPGRPGAGAKADYVAGFRKGQRVLVIGRLEIGEWTTREGEPRTSYDIWADDVVNLSPRDDGQSSGGPAVNGYSERAASPAGSAQRSSASVRPAAPERAEDLEDLPF